jgi:hypothetical protein
MVKTSWHLSVSLQDMNMIKPAPSSTTLRENITKDNSYSSALMMIIMLSSIEQIQSSGWQRFMLTHFWKGITKTGIYMTHKQITTKQRRALHGTFFPRINFTTDSSEWLNVRLLNKTRHPRESNSRFCVSLHWVLISKRQPFNSARATIEYPFKLNT